MMRRWLLQVGLLPLVISSCASPHPPLESYHRIDLPAHSDAPKLNPDEYDDLLSTLRSGDIMLGVREDPITSVVRLATTDPSYFTHTGTVEVVDAIPNGGRRKAARVWHAIGDFSLFNFSPHLMGKVRGGVRTIPLEEFIRWYDAVAVVRLPDPKKNEGIVNACRALSDANIEFDPFMDCQDASKLCCTELTIKSIRAAGYDVELSPARRSECGSIARLLDDLNVTTSAIYMAGQFEHLPGAETIAVISRYGRMDTYVSMRDAAMLIHDQINAGTISMADLAGFDRDRLVHYTEEMELFLRGVEGLAMASPTLDAATIRDRNEIVFEAVFAREVSAVTAIH